MMIWKRFVEYAEYDCKAWKNKKTDIRKNRKKSPDYVLAFSDGKIGVLESKGTLDANPSPHLRRALLQCDAGRELLRPIVSCDCSYASAVTFSTSKNHMRNTKIYFMDPEYGDREDVDVHQMICAGYAGWFYLAGCIKIAYALMRGHNIANLQEFIDLKERNPKESTEEGRILLGRRNFFSNTNQNVSYQVELGVEGNVLSYLQGDCAYRDAYENRIEYSFDGREEHYVPYDPSEEARYQPETQCGKTAAENTKDG